MTEAAVRLARRIWGPVDLKTPIRFRSLRREVFEGKAWQLRLEWDAEDSANVEIASEPLDGEGFDARALRGKGDVILLSPEEAEWLYHKLEMLFQHQENRRGGSGRYTTGNGA